MAVLGMWGGVCSRPGASFPAVALAPYTVGVTKPPAQACPAEVVQRRGASQPAAALGERVGLGCAPGLCAVVWSVNAIAHDRVVGFAL